jgi:hypothetical protein
MMGGALAKIDLRSPYLVGGAISVAIAIFSYRFIKDLGDESNQPDQAVKASS